MNINKLIKKFPFQITALSTLLIYYKYNQANKTSQKRTISLQASTQSNQSNQSINIQPQSKVKYKDPLWRSKIRKPLSDQSNVMFISGSCNDELSEEIADRLGVDLIKPDISIRNGEVFIKNIHNIDGKEVYLIQPTSPPVNDNLVNLLFLVNQLKRKGAKRVTIVCPFIGYSSRTISINHQNPVYASDIARMIEASGADCIFTLDIHAPQIEGFYNIPIDDIPTDIVLTEYLLNSNIVSNFNKLLFISPKPNRVKKSKEQAESIGFRTGIPVNIAMTVQVNTSSENENETFNGKVNLIGDVKGQDCVIIDDMIISGETIIKSAQKLKENGANKVFAYITHYLMNEDDLKKLEESQIDKLIITNSTGIIPKSNKIIMLSVGALLAEIIRRDYLCESMNEVYRRNYSI